MWHIRLFALVLLMVASMAALADMAVAAPRPTGRYDGRMSHDERVFLQVSGDATRLARYELSVETKCNGGWVLVKMNQRVHKRVSIDPSGGFAFAERIRDTFPDRRNRQVSGSATYSFSGRFSASGESVTGTASISFSSRKLKCSSGVVPFTLHLDGTRGAPFRNTWLATGNYAMSPSRGIRFRGPMRVFGPSEQASRFRLSWRAPCRVGGSIGFHEHVTRITLVGGVARDTHTQTWRAPGGIRGRYRVRWGLRFSFDGAYVVRGNWSVSVLLRGPRRSTRCELRNARFSGRFLGGPANTF
jgi:hypothetical protein